jgi:hypothetical protein
VYNGCRRLHVRAETIIAKCKVGVRERRERVVLVIIGALFSRWASWLPPSGPRIRYTYEITKSPATPLSFLKTLKVLIWRNNRDGQA